MFFINGNNSFTYIDNVLTNISKDFNIPIEELSKYSENNDLHTEKSISSCHCRARKQDGLRCTRRSKPNSIFCGKHILNRKYGCINNEQFIELKYFSNEDDTYLTDDYNIVYKKIDNEKYEIVGIRLSDRIKFLESINLK